VAQATLWTQDVCDTTWIQPKKHLGRWGFSQVILAIGHSGFLGRSEGWSDGRRNGSKDLGLARLGTQAVVVSFHTRHKISIYERYLEQIPRPPWVRCAQQGPCVMSVWGKKSNCCPGEESHVGSRRGLGGGLKSDAVGTCRLRRTGSQLLTVGWAGALSAVDLRCCVHASLPALGSLGFALVPRHCRIYWREKSEATRVLGELHGASVSSRRTSN
jgi:hypothetical protein